ncbi:Metalloenzyme, LuxS/M16 peptidase-like protein [Gilbertella persicaria]|uniref:Metalloenzyme, LuxS/M16 peptidase-like protein n=1 Tax=Gilbertella persicaria TaxID=101096 RepID=UPI00221E4EFC|nr:Metalloenzyme, LuxS/M16 peptidase-like protein [Gilbertella persicaria]KAI8097852.1 Metalloenzyme, LuxS/M16 peptidase-like protein [Gilbertella persicaria]
MTNFKEVCTVPTDFGVTFTKLRSDKIGLTVMLADIEGPLVNGYFALATESFDDFGCPHTLEHLVFLGSQQYPYKGVLDSLANRAIAQGTNAWTDVDHTCYTITTAGSEGFLKLLPIYVDHILYPTLTDTGYHTEVHHINGKGEDAGVVYSEMQGCQNLEDDRLHLRMKRIMYPETCGYRSETGGLMERLRELSVEKIRDYHKSYYRPDNLCLIVTGTVDKEELLKALEPVEESILSKGPLPEMQRPWVNTGDFPNLEKNVEETVLFADEDESMGSVLIAWNGPMCNDYLQQKELEVLNEYLTDSPVSVLQKEFVEIEDALCTDVDFHITDHLKSTLMFTASSVPLEEIENFPNEFFDLLKRLVETNDIDMTRMSTVIEKETLKLLESAETDAHGTAAAAVAISDFLYGSPDGKDLKNAVRDQEFLNMLAKYTAADWLKILKKWYIDAPHITLFGKPSAEFAEQQAEEETNRIEKQRSELGEEKLAELQKKLDDAMAKNDYPVPKEILEGFKIPSASTIEFINVITARNNDKTLSNEVQDHINQDNSTDVPLFIQYDHVKSHFVKLSAHVSASSIPSHLLPYTRLFLKAIFSLPIEKDGQLIGYEDVVKGLGEDTVEYEASLGTSFGFKEFAVFTLKAKSSKFEKSIQWLRDILWNTKLTPERLKIVASQILNDIPQAKRDGHDMGNATMRALQVDPKKSVNSARNILFQNNFLQDVVKRLEENPSSVLEELNEFRTTLCSPKNIRIHVTGDILSLKTPRTAFKSFAPPNSTYEPLASVTLSQQVLYPAGMEPGNNGFIVTLPSIENSFSYHTVKGPSRFEDSDIAPLLVMIELLDTMEGIFWKLIRGQGLAYSCFLDANIEAGLINFTVFRSPDAFKAFEQAKIVIEQLANHEMEIDTSAVNGAKSAVIYSLVAKENTMDRAALQSFVNQVLKKMPASYNRDLLIAIQAVTMDDLQHVLNKYFVNMFKPNTSNVVVVSTPNKIVDIQKGFERLGFGMKSIALNDITIDGIV